MHSKILSGNPSAGMDVAMMNQSVLQGSENLAADLLPDIQATVLDGMRMHENKLAYVDGMRGITILMVILVHTSQTAQLLSPLAARLAQYGQIGVQLFFVASAYTLCHSMERRMGERRRIASFYLRRLFRIAPLYYLAILFYFLVKITYRLLQVGNINSIEPYSLYNVAANIAFIHGFVPAANNNIVPGGWSIGTEMAFYLLFPLLFAFSRHIARRNLSHMVALFLLSVGIDMLIQYAIDGYTHQLMHNNDFRYFNLVNQLPVFIVGMLAYFLHHEKSAQSILASRLASAVGFVFFFGCFVWLYNAKGQPLIAIIPTVSAIAFAFLLNWLKALNFKNPVICKIGEVSYSMYVFHFVFAWLLVPALLSTFPRTENPDMKLGVAYLLVCVFTFVVASLTKKYIETKGILAGSRLISRLQNGSRNISPAMS